MSEAYCIIPISNLEPFRLRDIRIDVVEKIKNRVKEGYNPSRPLSVIKNNGKYIVADGNHRLEAVKSLGITEVPCIIHDDTDDPYTIAVQCNKDEDTYAPMDLFDWLDIVKQLKERGHTQQEIGGRIGWSRGTISQHQMLLDKVATDILDFARQHQEGRVADSATSVANFTEGWFRNSGLYDLQEEFQAKFFEWFEEKKFVPKTDSQKEQIQKLSDIQTQFEYLEQNLSPDVDVDEANKLRNEVLKYSYTIDSLKVAIQNLNNTTENRALFGVDALEELRKLPDGGIACVVTDPPWGVEFKPSRPTGNPKFDTGIENTVNYLDQVFKEIKRVTSANAHIYVFFPTSHYCIFREMLEQYFTIDSIPIVWVKNNHTPCDFKKNYASKYETIFFCKKENGDARLLNEKVSPDVLEYSIPQNKTHDCQKPVSLLEYFIRNSTGQYEKVLDPFAGTGSTLIAAKNTGRYYVGFESERDYESAFKRAMSLNGGVSV